MDVTSYLLGKQAGGGSAPTGTIDITENGTYNVSSYASADVDVQPDLESKSLTISTNTVTTIRPTEGKDGLSSVEVTTNVPQPSGKIEITQNGTDIDVSSYATADVNVAGNKFAFVNGGGFTFQYDTRSNLQPEIDNIVANVNMNTIKNLGYFLYHCDQLQTIDLTNMHITNASMSSAFAYCTSLISLNLSNIIINDAVNCSAAFFGCINLTFLDVRNIEFDKLSNWMNIFGNQTVTYSVPTDCLIIVKDATQKQWMNTNQSRFTNVQTVAEYEGS